MKKIGLTSQQLQLVKDAVSKGNPQVLYKLFANIVSSQFWNLNKFSDIEAMNYLNNNNYTY